LDISDNATIDVSKDGETVFTINVDKPTARKIETFETNVTLGDYLAQNLKDTGVFDVIVRVDGAEIAKIEYVSFLQIFYILFPDSSFHILFVKYL
jgi:hypothetical protein